MRLYIVCDVSKISGVLCGGCPHPPWFWFPDLEKDELRVQMSACVNAAAEEAFGAGATELLVHEACPVDMFSLHEDVRLIRGAQTLYVDESFAGIVFVGQGLTRHLESSTGSETNITQVTLNGTVVDELAICALYAGSFGVPVLLAQGDAQCVSRLRSFLPDLAAVESLDGALARSIREVDGLAPARLEGRVEVQFTFESETLAEWHLRLPNVVRVDARTTAVHAGDAREAFDAYRRCGLVAAVDWFQAKGIHKAGAIEKAGKKK
ncbi:MAG: M55 family metallopeptidase [Kiritimatiellae bacterium]|nr:M55 family metallopeptidase [Kiritimatiellia bacterium]